MEYVWGSMGGIYLTGWNIELVLVDAGVTLIISSYRWERQDGCILSKEYEFHKIALVILM